MSPDQHAFERMFRAHYDAVLAYALRRTTPDDARDVVADTFLVAWRRLDDAPPGAERAWLYAIARRTLANQRRATRRRHALTDRLHPSTFEHVETDTRLAEALALLTEQDREALLLIAWEGLSCDDAAHVVGCRAATFRMRLHRARRRLSEHLNDPQAVVQAAAVKEGAR